MLNRPTHVVLAYKNFSALSHAGLGVSALGCLKTFISKGIPAEAWSLQSANDLIAQLVPVAEKITHLVVSAPWIPTTDWQRIVTKFPWIQFAVNCHSNVGFLSADPGAIKLIRDGMHLEQATHNFHVAANCTALARWLVDAYASPCAYLPNMYWLDGTTRQNRPLFTGGVLRIGCFGATRPLKNHVTAAAAAIEIASRMKCDLEFWVSGGRPDGGQTAMRSIEEMFAGLTYATLKRANWASWPEFRKIVASMHLLMQPSYTESFNMVTADGIAEGVPSVVSEAIEWVPDHWKADNDDPFEVARVGRMLIGDMHAAHEGMHSLLAYNKAASAAWMEFLES